MKIPQDHILGKGDYGNVERQSLYDSHTLALYYATGLKALERIERVGKEIEPFTNAIQGPKKIFSYFL